MVTAERLTRRQERIFILSQRRKKFDLYSISLFDDYFGESEQELVMRYVVLV